MVKENYTPYKQKQQQVDCFLYNYVVRMGISADKIFLVLGQAHLGIRKHLLIKKDHTCLAKDQLI